MRIKIAVLTTWLILTGAALARWDEYKSPEIVACGTDGVLAIQSSAGGCLQLSGATEYQHLYSSMDDHYSLAQYYLRTVAQTETDFGQAIAVLRINGWSTNQPVAWFGSPKTGPGDTIVDEAFLSFGDNTSVTVGVVTPKYGTAARQDDDQPLDFWGKRSIILDRSEGLFWDYGLALGGAVLQLRHELTDGAAISLAVEGLDRDQADPPSWNSPGPGTAIATFSYDDETISGHLTGLAAGLLGGTAARFSTHGGLNAEFGAISVSSGFKIETEPSGKSIKWAGLASAAFDDGLINVAGTVELGAERSQSDYWLASGSAGVHLTNALLIEVAGYFGQNDYGVRSTSGRALSFGLEWQATEQISIQLDVGHYDVAMTGAQYGVSYGAGSATWRPHAGVEMMARGEYYSNGAWRTAAMLRKSFE